MQSERQRVIRHADADRDGPETLVAVSPRGIGHDERDTRAREQQDAARRFRLEETLKWARAQMCRSRTTRHVSSRLHRSLVLRPDRWADARPAQRMRNTVNKIDAHGIYQERCTRRTCVWGIGG